MGWGGDGCVSVVCVIQRCRKMGDGMIAGTHERNGEEAGGWGDKGMWRWV